MMTSSSNENNSNNASNNSTENKKSRSLSPLAVYSASNPGGQRIVWVQLPDTPRWPGRVVTNIEAGKPALIEHDRVSYFPFIYFLISDLWFSCFGMTYTCLFRKTYFYLGLKFSGN